GEPMLLVRVVAPDKCADAAKTLVDLAAVPADDTRRHQGKRKRGRIAANPGAGACEAPAAITKLVERRAERVVLGGVARGERGGAPLGAPTENERRIRLLD